MNRLTKFLLSSALVAALGGFLAGPAVAEVIIFVDIFKDKDIIILEDIDKIKRVTINVDAVINPETAAESSAIKNQVNKHNTVDLDFVTGTLVEDARDALMDHSVRDDVGVTQFNQDVGNMVNQANVVSIALTTPDPTTEDTTFVESQASQEQINKHNTVIELGKLALNPEDPDYEAIIDHSVRDNLGITQVNQNSGNMNNQDNNLSVALGLDNGAVVALSEADLGQVNKHNSVNSKNTIKRNTLLWSVRNNTGITSVNQSTGNMNNQDTSISFAAFSGPASQASTLPTSFTF